jgi:O-antigen/teichoic acid export membrane protein
MLATKPAEPPPREGGDAAPPDPTGADPSGGRGLADRIGMVVGSSFVSTLIGLLQGILIVRLLAKEDYGAMSFVLAIYATGRDLGLCGVPESILYFAPKITTPELKGLVAQSRRLLLALGFFVAAVLAGLSLDPSLFLDGREGLGVMLLLIGLSSILGFRGAVFGNVFIATNNHKRSASIGLIMTFVGTAGSLVPAALGCSVQVILLFHALGMGVRLVLSEWIYRRLFPGPTAPFRGGLRAQLDYVLPLAVTRFAGIFNQKLDRLLIGLFFTAAAFAEFSVGAQELPLVSVLPYSVATAIMPQLVQLFERGATRELGVRSALELWHASIRKVALVMVPIGVLLIVVAPSLMQTLYGVAYRSAAAPFRVYSALLPLRVTSYGVVLMAFGQTSMILRVQILGMVLNVGLSLLLLSRIGMIGAPISAVATQAFMIVFLLYRIHLVGRVGLRGIFPWRHYGKVTFAAVCGATPAAVIQALPALEGRAPLVLIAGIPLFLAIYLPIAIGLGALSAEDRAFVARWVRLEPLRKGKEDPAREPQHG